MVQTVEQHSLREAPTATLEELREVVTEVSRTHHDMIVEAGRIEYDAETGIIGTEGGQEFGLLPLALMQLGSKLGIPGHYLAKCPTELRAENINHWLQENRTRRLFLRCNGDSVRAVLSERYAPVDHIRLVNWLADVYGWQATLRFELTDEQLLVQFIGNQPTEVGCGDELFPGLSVRNSEVGLACVELSGLIYRRICLNGLILSGKHGQWKRKHVGDSSFGTEVRAAIGLLRDSAGNKTPRFGKLQGIQVDDMPGLFERLTKRFELTKAQHEAIKSAFDVEPGDSLYAAINAVTRAGNAEGLELDSRRQLQEVGGQMLELANQGTRWLN